MSQLILVSHGHFAKELKKSAEMILGPQENMHTVSLLPNEGQEDFANKFDEVVKNLEGDITVFADLLGGTPANVISKKIIEGKNYQLYSGMNLPMIISYINSLLIDGVPNLVEDGQKGIVEINQILDPDNNSEDE